jgi:hypothetical protein
LNRIGKVTGYEVLKNRDGQNDRLMLQVEIVNSDDIQTVELRNSYGEDSNPLNDTQVLILEVGEAFKIAIAADDGITPSMLPGEKKIYSVSGSGIEAFINFLTSGVLELNGNTDFAVAFNDLKVAFDQLKSDFDAHTHLYTPGGGAPVQTGAPPASTADIDPAKVDTIKLP